VKVLDFGLSKALGTTTAQAALSNSPTVMDSGAPSGIILGTAGYMSPEQAKGRSADARSDIFSFGCVLYEMLSGGRPFPGDSYPEVLAGVLAREPDLTKLPVNLNPRVLELFRRCLDKDPRRRWHAAADVRVEIGAILADPQGALVQSQPAKLRSARSRAVMLAAALVLGAVIAFPAVWFNTPRPIQPVTRFTFPIEGVNFTRTGRQFLSISPDGSKFVYTAGNRIRVKPLRELDPIELQGPEGDVVNPVFSPDGQSIAFISIADQALKRIPTAGGAPITLCPVENNVFGMSWETEGQILFGQGVRGIWRVAANAGKPENIIPSENSEILHGPHLLPGGQSILFTARNASSGWDQAKIVVQTPGKKDRKVLIENATDARYLPTGHLVYYSGGNLRAVPFDTKTFTVGEPVPIVEEVRFSTGGNTSGSAQFSVANNGTLIYAQGDPPLSQPSAQQTVTLVDHNGVRSPTALLPNNYASVRMSPDGKHIAVGIDDGKEANIWVYDLTSKAAISRLTFGGRNLYPLWSGDGERILYQSDREGDKAIFWQRADGNGVAERLTKPEMGVAHMPESWLPPKDSQKFSFRVTSAAGHEEIWLHAIQEKKALPLIASPGFNQNASAFSPNGKWVAYQSDEPGSPGLFVQPFPTAGGAKFLIDALGAQAAGRYGYFPTWSPDSKEVFFHRSGVGVLHGVRIQTEPAFTKSEPSNMAVTNFRYDPKIRKYDITPDGKQFLMLFGSQSTTPAVGPGEPSEIRVVLNWFEELNRLVPPK
jgi:serine/threonine-protein kinase